MVKIERLSAASDSESESSSNGDESSNNSDESSVDEERARILRRMELQPDSDSESEEEEEEDFPSGRRMQAAEDDGSSSEEDDEDESDDSDSEDEDKNNNLQKRKKKKSDDQWSDEEEEENSDSDASSSDEEENRNLSLQERLSKQESKQSSMRTVTSLKDQRERRQKAASVAKERLKALKESKKPSTTQPQKTKKSKHAPTEVSSRRRHNKTLNESGIGVEIGSNRYQPRDPRMSSLSGHLNAEQHDYHYGFLKEVQTKELAQLKLQMKSYNMTGKRGQRERRKLGLTPADSRESIQERLTQLQQGLAVQNQQRLERTAKKAVKQKLQQRVKDGKGGVYYPKRAELKKLQMQAKVEVIEQTKGKSGLNKYLAKRRKKQKSVHAKKMRFTGNH